MNRRISDMKSLRAYASDCTQTWIKGDADKNTQAMVDAICEWMNEHKINFPFDTDDFGDAGELIYERAVELQEI